MAQISPGLPDAHKIPTDFKNALATNPKALAQWESITPIARNEWICWITFPKKQETRDEHLKRAVSELKDGERRPCCWMGCTHRKDKELNATQRWITSKQSKKKK